MSATNFCLLFITLTAFAASALGQSASEPTFERYRAHSERKVDIRPPQFDEEQWPGNDSKFRDSVRAAATRGPNFAGEFAIAQVSCGTACIYIAVIEEKSGTVYVDMPFFSLITNARSWKSPNPPTHKALEFRLDSRLLIAEGAFDSTSGQGNGYSARKYYEWVGDKFRLLRSEPRNVTRE